MPLQQSASAAFLTDADTAVDMQHALPLAQHTPLGQQAALLDTLGASLSPQHFPSFPQHPLPFAQQPLASLDIIRHLPSAQQAILPSLFFAIIGQDLPSLPSLDDIAMSPQQDFPSLAHAIFPSGVLWP
jgi:hypothetical protein